MHLFRYLSWKVFHNCRYSLCWHIFLLIQFFSQLSLLFLSTHFCCDNILLTLHIILFSITDYILVCLFGQGPTLLSYCLRMQDCLGGGLCLVASYLLLGVALGWDLESFVWVWAIEILFARLDRHHVVVNVHCLHLGMLSKWDNLEHRLGDLLLLILLLLGFFSFFDRWV